MYDLPHGVCNAIFLPYLMEYNMSFCTQKYERIARAMGLESDALAAVNAVKQLAKAVQLPSFSSLKVNPADYVKIASVSAQNGSNGSNPRPMTEQDYMAVLNMADKDN
jgi:alcohol dehydrogenase